MLFWLLAAFIVVPLAELYLLLRVADVTGIPTTIGIVIVTAIVGSFLARREGVQAWTRFRNALGEGRVPSQEIQDGLMIVFAGALLLTPGLLTDAFGFFLLLPAGRRLVRAHLLKRALGRGKWVVHTYGSSGPGEHSIDPRSAPFERARPSDPLTIDAESVQRRH